MHYEVEKNIVTIDQDLRQTLTADIYIDPNEIIKRFNVDKDESWVKYIEDYVEEEADRIASEHIDNLKEEVTTSWEYVCWEYPWERESL